MTWLEQKLKPLVAAASGECAHPFSACRGGARHETESIVNETGRLMLGNLLGGAGEPRGCGGRAGS